MKRWCKRPPREAQATRHGKPHRVQGQIGNRGAARSASAKADRFRVSAAKTNDSLHSQGCRQKSAYSSSRINFNYCSPDVRRRISGSFADPSPDVVGCTCSIHKRQLIRLKECVGVFLPAGERGAFLGRLIVWSFAADFFCAFLLDYFLPPFLPRRRTRLS